MLASNNGRVDLCQRLIQAGASASATDGDGCTALHAACIDLNLAKERVAEGISCDPVGVCKPSSRTAARHWLASLQPMVSLLVRIANGTARTLPSLRPLARSFLRRRRPSRCLRGGVIANSKLHRKRLFACSASSTTQVWAPAAQSRDPIPRAPATRGRRAAACGRTRCTRARRTAQPRPPASAERGLYPGSRESPVLRHITPPRLYLYAARFLSHIPDACRRADAAPHTASITEIVLWRSCPLRGPI